MAPFYSKRIDPVIQRFLAALSVPTPVIYECGLHSDFGTAVLKEILFENNDKDVFLQCFKESPAMKLFERIEFGKIMETEQHYIMKKIKK